MRRILIRIGWLLIGLLVLVVAVFTIFYPSREDPLTDILAKPAIYLYPTETTEVEVQLDLKGKLTFTYPEYREGWRVTAHPDGTLIDKEGASHRYLFWEGEAVTDFDLQEGYLIPREETVPQLKTILSRYGLNEQEINDCIVYWAPQMTAPYHLVSVQAERYTELAALEITPQPDTLIRVFLAIRPLDRPIEVREPDVQMPDRQGFTVVEWGGSLLGKDDRRFE